MKRIIFVLVALIAIVGLIVVGTPQKAKTQSWSNQVKTDTLKVGTTGVVFYNNLGTNRWVYVSVTDTGATFTDSVICKVVSKKGNTTDTIQVGLTDLLTETTAARGIVNSAKKTYMVNYEEPWIVLIERVNVSSATGTRSTVLFKGDTPKTNR